MNQQTSTAGFGTRAGKKRSFMALVPQESRSEQHIAFVLGHALYMRLIHGGKGKNYRIDAGKIARLLRGGTFPLAYAYPKGTD